VPTISNARMFERASLKLAALHGSLMITFSADLMPKANSLDAFSACSNEPSRVFKNV
jgi:hypothetical protein